MVFAAQLIMQNILYKRLYDRPALESIPPANVEAEESILGGILLDPNSFDLIALARVDLSPEVFSLISHQIIFEQAVFLNKAGLPTDFRTMHSHLDDRGLLEKIGGQSKLIQLMDRTVSTVNIDEYVKLIFDKYQRRKIIELGNELTALAYNGVSTVEEMDEKRQELSVYIQKGGIRRGLDMQLLDREMQEIGEEDSLYRDLRLKNMAKRWGFSLKDLKDMHCKWVLSNLLKPQYFTLDSYHQHCKEMKTDWILPGFIPRQSQTCFYGPGGVGKTRMIHAIIYALIAGIAWGDYEVDGPKRVLVVQSDQGDRENHQMLDIQGFYALTPEQRERYAVITNWTTSKLGYLKKRIEEHKPDLVVFDSLTTVNVDTVTDENSMRYATPLIHWKRLAQEYNCSNIVLHHANKGGGMRGTTAIHNTVDEVWRLSHRNERPNGT
ncbi:DnaB-like helicase N-terminal domain-containing protein [Roseofilum casamattae]|uniref:DnaB-like helicase N-terminal domain-containing protein n=1 Tax=Roseofilum casamattae BLCC-M143 TaxID=3022442 RepID=A0ABT7C358_9CYAN|nr:DnaB-like helicase N-terminal domain-containing protein [Roseofilum casamattae]MDJ1185897.1 DnaB-like helicase N-terminal domain-containing protein [Roseofilum casamattae BLCC-M143]